MNPIQLNKALQEMQALAKQAQSAQAPTEPAKTEFAATLKQAVGEVNRLQGESTAKSDAFLRGEPVSLTEVMVAQQKARVAFEATKQVRNRLLEAYQEISRMQV